VLLQLYSAVSSILSLMHFLMHTGSVYTGVEFSKRLCGVSVIRRYQLYKSPIISCGVWFPVSLVDDFHSSSTKYTIVELSIKCVFLTIQELEFNSLLMHLLLMLCYYCFPAVKVWKMLCGHAVKVLRSGRFLFIGKETMGKRLGLIHFSHMC
jgi:hypothetical protein